MIDAGVIGSCFYFGVISLCWTELCIGQRRLLLTASFNASTSFIGLIKRVLIARTFVNMHTYIFKNTIRVFDQVVLCISVCCRVCGSNSLGPDTQLSGWVKPSLAIQIKVRRHTCPSMFTSECKCLHTTIRLHRFLENCNKAV